MEIDILINFENKFKHLTLNNAIILYLYVTLEIGLGSFLLQDILFSSQFW